MIEKKNGCLEIAVMHLRCILIVVLICSLSLPAFATADQGCCEPAGCTGSAENLGSQAPCITLEKTLFEFATIRPRSQNTATFTFRNTGEETLKITGIDKCCGTTVTVDRRELAPGQSGQVQAVLRAGERPGALKKEIALLTNDPLRPRVPLTLSATVVQTLTWSPRRLALTWRGDEIECPTITLKNADGQPFAIKRAAVTGSGLVLPFDPNCRQADFGLRPQVHRDKLAALARPAGVVKLQLDHPDYNEITLGFELVPPVQATPGQVLVFGSKAGQPFVRKVILTDNQADPNEPCRLKVVSVVAEQGARVRILRQAPSPRGCDLDQELTPARGAVPAHFNRDEIVLKCSDNRCVRIPVRIFLKPGQGHRS